jgi:hypothetical protein
MLPQATGPDRRPRTPQGRLRQNYQRRLAEAEAELAATPAEERYDLNRTTAAMAKLDEVYVSGALVRALDPELRRLRRAQRIADRRLAS